jgi:hypothetical protein
MNRSLPPGDGGCRIPTARGAPGSGRAVPGAAGLVGGVAAIAGEPGVGHRCTTFGPRSLRRPCLGVSAKAAVTWPPRARCATIRPVGFQRIKHGGFACHRIGPYQQTAPGVFICESCEQAADAHLQKMAETVPELRDHRLRRWRMGCDCDRCRRRGHRAV